MSFEDRIPAGEVRAGDWVHLGGTRRKVDEVLDEPPASDNACYTRSDNVWLRTGKTVTAVLGSELVQVEREVS